MTEQSTRLPSRELSTTEKTTAVPLLWTVSSRFFEDKTPGYKYFTIALAVLGTIIGLALPFSDMVNLVYVINGYVGIHSRFARDFLRKQVAGLWRLKIQIYLWCSSICSAVLTVRADS